MNIFYFFIDFLLLLILFYKIILHNYLIEFHYNNFKSFFEKT